MAELEGSVWPPDPIVTERLVLRSTRASDRDGYLELLWSPASRQYLGGPVGSREDLDRAAPDVPGARPGVFAIDLGGRFIGMIQLDRRDTDQPGHIHPEGGELEVSYSLRQPFWGAGYAQEAVEGVMKWAASALPDDDVLLLTQLQNDRSLRLARRLGFDEIARFTHFGADQWLGHRTLRTTISRSHGGRPVFDLRPVDATDLATLYRLHRAAMRTYVEKVWGWDDDDQYQRFSQYLQRASLQAILIDGQIVGLVDVAVTHDAIEVVNIEVDPSYQGQGIGTMILTNIMEDARTEDRAVKLQVLRVNTAAYRLYARLGFSPSGETPTHWLMTYCPGDADGVRSVAKGQ